MERCLICLEDLPIEKLCADVEGSKGLLIDGCKHFYCVECVKKFPKEHMKCSLCNLKMVRFISHQCQKCQWGLYVEAGGAGDFRFCHLEECFGLEETEQIIEGEKFHQKINIECLTAELSKLPCYTKTSRRLNKEIIKWLGDSLFQDVKWYPLFEGRENPETDPFVCTSMKLFQDECVLNMIVVAEWEDSKKDLYYGFKSVKWDGFFRITPRDPSNCQPISNTNIGFPNGCMITVCEEFIHRMGWDKVLHEDGEMVSESGE